MMNYKTYQTLTPQQKEEYNFRFSEKLYLNFQYVSYIITIGMLTMMVLFFTTYMIIKEPALESYKPQLSLYISSMGSIVVVTGWVIVSALVEQLIRMIIRSIQYYKWKKTNNIIVVHWWNTWLK